MIFTGILLGMDKGVIRRQLLQLLRAPSLGSLQFPLSSPWYLLSIPYGCEEWKKYYFKNECEGFITFPSTRKHLIPRGRKRLETWWNPKHEFLKWLFQRNNTKLCSVVFFPLFFKMPCMCDLLHSVGIYCICWPFVFNYPIVSRCTKFLFQKRYELEVIFCMAEGRFRFLKTIEEEQLCIERAVPKSTRYKNMWAVGIFDDW